MFLFQQDCFDTKNLKACGSENNKTGNVPYNHLQQIEDLDTELIVKIAIAGVGHVVDKYESISLSL